MSPNVLCLCQLLLQGGDGRLQLVNLVCEAILGLQAKRQVCVCEFQASSAVLQPVVAAPGQFPCPPPLGLYWEVVLKNYVPVPEAPSTWSRQSSTLGR